MSRLKAMQIAYTVEKKFEVKTRAGQNCIYVTPYLYLGEDDKITCVENLTTEIVDFLRDTKQVVDCFCRITGEEVKISFF